MLVKVIIMLDCIVSKPCVAADFCPAFGVLPDTALSVIRVCASVWKLENLHSQVVLHVKGNNQGQMQQIARMQKWFLFRAYMENIILLGVSCAFVCPERFDGLIRIKPQAVHISGSHTQITVWFYTVAVLMNKVKFKYFKITNNATSDLLALTAVFAPHSITLLYQRALQCMPGLHTVQTLLVAKMHKATVTHILSFSSSPRSTSVYFFKVSHVIFHRSVT